MGQDALLVRTEVNLTVEKRMGIIAAVLLVMHKGTAIIVNACVN